MFAPVYFPNSVVYTRPGFRFSLDVVVDLGLLNVNLFCYPRYSHYYFGDYYDDDSVSIGIFPCFESERRHSWYDPIYQYDRWHSKDPRWEEHERNSYEQRRNDRDLRPARTYREQESRMSKLPEAQRNNLQIARPMSAVAASKSSPHKFEQIDNDTRQKISKQANDVHTYREARSKWESTDTTGAKDAQPVRDVQVSPKVSQPATERVKEESPRSTQKSADHNEPAVQPERVKVMAPKDVQVKQKVSQPSEESVKEENPRSTQKPVDRNESAKQSERVKVPNSPVADRVPPSANREKQPSAPAEERRGQDDGRDSRQDDGKDSRRDDGKQGKH